METGKGPGHSRRVGDGKARRKAEALETMRKIGNELFFSAEERSRARDVEEKAVGAILFIEGRDRGRVARRPERQMLEGDRIAFRIGGFDLQELSLGARIAHAIADIYSQGFGRRIGGGDARAARRLGGEHEGAFRIDRPLARQGVAGLGVAGFGVLRLCREETQDRPSGQPG